MGNFRPGLVAKVDLELKQLGATVCKQHIIEFKLGSQRYFYFYECNPTAKAFHEAS